MRDCHWLQLDEALQEVMLLPLYCSLPSLGVLLLIGPRKSKTWGLKDLKRLATFARMAGMALEADAQRQRLEHRIQQSAAVSEIAQNVNTTLDLDILLRLVILEITKAMNSRPGTFG